MNLDSFVKGWIVGDFSPALLKSKDIEVGIKKYKTGDFEAKHVHNLVDEYTIIVSGIVEMDGVKYSENDIVFVPKGVPTDFKCLENSITVVLKTPSIPSDKQVL